jgi:peptidoglycan/LPS O-acetylase OafA/YrhL
VEKANEIQSRASSGAGQESGKGPGFHLGYVRGLDGLRGISILMVVLSHMDAVPFLYGFAGVTVFFALSGFLITCLLIEEWDQTGGISLRAFYARRALRLLPALLVMLAAFLIYSRFFHSPKIQRLDVREALLALFYAMNWALALGYVLPHTLEHCWSLSIEEQFYLLWPALLYFLLRRTLRGELLRLVFLMAVLSCLERIFLSWWTYVTVDRMARGLDTRADALLLGCAAGIAAASGLLPRRRWLEAVLHSGSVIFLAVLAWTSLMPFGAGVYAYYASWFFMSLSSALMVVELTALPRGMIHLLLNTAPLVWLGRVSYGLYLWHFPIFKALKEAGLSSSAKYWYLYLGLPLLPTVASYYLVERPCLRWKRRFQKAK